MVWTSSFMPCCHIHKKAPSTILEWTLSLIEEQDIEEQVRQDIEEQRRTLRHWGTSKDIEEHWGHWGTSKDIEEQDIEEQVKTLGTSKHIFNICQSVLACIELVFHMYWIIIRANTGWIHTTIYAKYGGNILVCIAIHTNTLAYQHLLACVALVFGMYEIMILAKTDQIHTYFFNLYQCWSQFIHQYYPNTIQHRPIQAQIQSNTSTNIHNIVFNTCTSACQYRYWYCQTNTHKIVFNTCTSTCQYRHRYCQIRRPSQHCQTVPVWLNFFPNSSSPLPFFHTNCPDGSHFAQKESHFAQNTTPNPCSLLSRHKPPASGLSGICTYTKHLQPNQWPQNTPSLAWT